MGRTGRSEVDEFLLHTLLASKNEVDESQLLQRLNETLASDLNVEDIPQSTYYDHLKRLEQLDFVSLHPFRERNKKIPVIIVKPEILGLLYALYRSNAVKKNPWTLPAPQIEAIINSLCAKIAGHFAKCARLLGDLAVGDPQMEALTGALGRLLSTSGGQILQMHYGMLLDFSREMFERYVDFVDVDGRKVMAISVSKFEKNYPAGSLKFYKMLASVLAKSFRSGEGLDKLADAWFRAFKEVIADLPTSEKLSLAVSIKNEFHSYYARILRGLPPFFKAEYRKRYAEAGLEEVVQVVRCPHCARLDVKVDNIFDLIKREAIQCGKCGKEIPIKFSEDKNFLKEFAKWARGSFIPHHLAPMLIKLREGLSMITCSVLSYRNIVVKGTTSKIFGKLIPPHPRQEVNIALADPEGITGICNAVTDDDGEYEVEYRFDKCGQWRIYASWPGDGDHYGSTSKEITVLVYEFS